MSVRAVEQPQRRRRPEEPQLPSGQQQPHRRDRQRLVVPFLHDQQQLARRAGRGNGISSGGGVVRGIGVLPRRPAPAPRTSRSRWRRSGGRSTPSCTKRRKIRSGGLAASDDRLRQVLERQRDRIEVERWPGRSWRLARLRRRRLQRQLQRQSSRRAVRADRESARFWSSTMRTSAKLRDGPCECASVAASSGSVTSWAGPSGERPLIAEARRIEWRAAHRRRRRRSFGVPERRLVRLPPASRRRNATHPAPAQLAAFTASCAHGAASGRGQHVFLQRQRHQRQRDGEPDERRHPIQPAERRQVVEKTLERRDRDQADGGDPCRPIVQIDAGRRAASCRMRASRSCRSDPARRVTPNRNVISGPVA